MGLPSQPLPPANWQTVQYLSGRAVNHAAVGYPGEGKTDLRRPGDRERFRRHRLAEVILSRPGFGFRLGAEFLAAAVDLSLIESADRLAAYAGLAPVRNDSGKRTGRLHKPLRYHRRLRRAMYISAITAARCDPASKAGVRVAQSATASGGAGTGRGCRPGASAGRPASR